MPRRRAGMGPAPRPVLQVVLVLAISLTAIVAFATLHEPVVGEANRSQPQGTVDIDARWSPKWGAAAEVSTAGERAIVDTRWTPKEKLAENPEALDSSEARGSEAG